MSQGRTASPGTRGFHRSPYRVEFSLGHAFLIPQGKVLQKQRLQNIGSNGKQTRKPRLNRGLLEARMSPLPQRDIDMLVTPADTIFG